MWHFWCGTEMRASLSRSTSVEQHPVTRPRSRIADERAARRLAQAPKLSEPADVYYVVRASQLKGASALSHETRWLDLERRHWIFV